MFVYCNKPYQNGLLIAREMKTQGHEVLVKCLVVPERSAPFQYPLIPGGAQYRYDRDMFESAKQFKPDYLFVTGAGIETRNLFEEISELGIKLVLWKADAYIPGEDKGYWDRYKGVFDLIITSVEGMVEVLKGYAKKVVFLPQYYDQTYYKPTIERLDPKHEIYDVCFIGSAQKRSGVSVREDCIRALKKICEVKVFGNVPGFSSGTELYGTKMANVYVQSKITFDTPHIVKRDMGWKISDRVFKAMGCGCFFICPPMKGLEQFFVPGKHLITYDGSINDLKSKVEYYLEHEKEREKIAKCGQDEIMKNHTIEVRVKQYIEAMGG